MLANVDMLRQIARGLCDLADQLEAEWEQFSPEQSASNQVYRWELERKFLGQRQKYSLLAGSLLLQACANGGFRADPKWRGMLGFNKRQAEQPEHRRRLYDTLCWKLSSPPYNLDYDRLRREKGRAIADADAMRFFCFASAACPGGCARAAFENQPPQTLPAEA
jgi:hypothetical protein